MTNTTQTNDNDAFGVPPDAYRTDFRSHEMVCAVAELVKCPNEEFDPRVILEMQLAASVLLGKLKQVGGEG
jgi:hypothetical protein